MPEMTELLADRLTKLEAIVDVLEKAARARWGELTPKKKKKRTTGGQEA